MAQFAEMTAKTCPFDCIQIDDTTVGYLTNLKASMHGGKSVQLLKPLQIAGTPFLSAFCCLVSLPSIADYSSGTGSQGVVPVMWYVPLASLFSVRKY